jgi:hypothetical protein
MGKDQCVAADWRMIGYEDGLHGLPGRSHRRASRGLRQASGHAKT